MRPYYAADGITIYHGDCREVIAHVETSIAAVITSPPYNQMASLMGPPSGMRKNADAGRAFMEAWQARGYADDEPESEYQRSQNVFFADVLKICTPNASLFYNHQLRWRNGAVLHPVIWFHPEGWQLRQEIVWDRCGGMMFNARMFVRFDERILWFVQDSWQWNQDAVGFGTVWTVPRAQQSQGKRHPVGWPDEIPRRCILAATQPGDTVLDPFMGAGTTLACAKRYGRCAIGIDIDERYCEMAAEELAQRSLFATDERVETQLSLLLAGES